MRNPVKSMSGNMWAGLLDLRKKEGGPVEGADSRMTRTLRALVKRGHAEVVKMSPLVYCYRITAQGKLVADAYAEGQEAKA